MRPAPLGVVVLWIAATAALTTTTWQAVRVVADEVGGTPVRVLSAAAVRSAAAEVSPISKPAPISEPAPTSKPRPSASPHHPTSVTPAPSRSSHPSSSNHATPSRTTSPKPSASPSKGGGGTAAVSKTFAVTGGTIAASCTGSAVSLSSAQPNDGWRVEVHDRGPEALEITFRSGEHETEVRIHCSGGVPVLASEGDDGGSDD